MSDPFRSCDEIVEVLVIGAGPVGLATAVQLGRYGIDTRVVERRSSLSRHPKAGGIHARTMEILRQWGISDAIRVAGRGDANPNDQKPASTMGFGWMTRLNGIELGAIDMGSEHDRRLFSSQSPEASCGCGQDLYEPILYREANRHPSVSVQFGTLALLEGQDDSGVDVTLRDPATGRDISRIRAKYVVACDGVRSPTRQALGIGEDGEPAFGDSINVRFRADLETHRRDRRYGLFWVVNGDTQGALAWRRRGNEWTYNFEAKPGEDPQSYTDERCVELIRLAVGDPEVKVEIQSILHWRHDQAVTQQWREGRVFLAGDSAHRFPPHGGFGMNSGVQDSANLVWKLWLVLRGKAGNSLLDTYEEERKPVAEFNGRQALVNTRRMEQTGWLLNDTEFLASIEEDNARGRALRNRIGAAIPAQKEQFYSQGQQFGTIYQSGAVVADGRRPEVSSVRDYVPSGQPGGRAPHLWLQGRDGQRISTIDLFYRNFVAMLAPDGERWRAEVMTVADLFGVPVDVVRLAPDGDLAVEPGQTQFTDLYGIGSDGLVLVRPDGHVLLRLSHHPEEPTEFLTRSLGGVLGVVLPVS